MNKAHLDFLASDRWAEMLQTDLLPWLTEVGDLGDCVLEVGPGPGLTTDLLRMRTSELVAIEVDSELARALAARLSGTNVTVLNTDATRSGLESNRFSAATCFSVIHHVPSLELQDRLFCELYRMLRPGGILIATDSVDSEGIRRFHQDDTFLPLDAETLFDRLASVGFTSISLEKRPYELRFSAVKERAA